MHSKWRSEVRRRAPGARGTMFRRKAPKGAAKPASPELEPEAESRDRVVSANSVRRPRSARERAHTCSTHARTLRKHKLPLSRGRRLESRPPARSLHADAHGSVGHMHATADVRISRLVPLRAPRPLPSAQSRRSLCAPLPYKRI